MNVALIGYGEVGIEADRILDDLKTSKKDG